MGLLKFFGEVNTLAQRPDILSACKLSHAPPQQIQMIVSMPIQHTESYANGDITSISEIVIRIFVRVFLCYSVKVLNVDALREQGQKAITAYVVSSGKPLLLPSISDAVDKVSFESIIPPEAHSTTLQFFNFVGDGVMPTSELQKRRALGN